jgi:hypothetical protein
MCCRQVESHKCNSMLSSAFLVAPGVTQCQRQHSAGRRVGQYCRRNQVIGSGWEGANDRPGVKQPNAIALAARPA